MQTTFKTYSLIIYSSQIIALGVPWACRYIMGGRNEWQTKVNFSMVTC